MKYEDARLLLRYARLQLEIALAKNPSAQLDMSAAHVHRSVGYKKLRAWFMRMSQRKRDDARRWLTMQCDGIEKIKALATASGEDVREILRDIEITHRDDRGAEVEPLALPDVRDARVDEPTPEELERERESAQVTADSLRAAMAKARS